MTPLTQNDNGDCLIICQHCGKVTQVQCKEAALSPCEENGCTDTENCDEICIHHRIYSQAQMDVRVAQAREEVLEKLRMAIGERTWIDSDGDLHEGALTIQEIEESLRTEGGDE